ncbi:MAG: GNAT family N-acetyltransferase [Pseudomonadota bacterium]
MTVAPTLETERLVLRAPRFEDFEPMATLLCSDRAALIGGPYDRERAWSEFAAEVGSWALLGVGYWAITDRSTNETYGMTGLGKPPHFLELEIGWSVVAKAEGKGIAFEAAQAVLAHAFGPMGVPTLVSYIDPANARSAQLAERLGARIDPEATAPWPEDVVYRHDPETQK